MLGIIAAIVWFVGGDLNWVIGILAAESLVFDLTIWINARRTRAAFYASLRAGDNAERIARQALAVAQDCARNQGTGW